MESSGNEKYKLHQSCELIYRHLNQPEFIDIDKINHSTYKAEETVDILDNITCYDMCYFNPSPKLLDVFRKIRYQVLNTKEDIVMTYNMKEEFENNHKFYIHEDENGSGFVNNYDTSLKDLEKEVYKNKLEIPIKWGNSTLIYHKVDTDYICYTKESYMNILRDFTPLINDLNNIIVLYLYSDLEKFIDIFGTNIEKVYHFGFCSQNTSECIEFVNWIELYNLVDDIDLAINFNINDPEYLKIGLLNHCEEDTYTEILKKKDDNGVIFLTVDDLINAYNKDKNKYKTIENFLYHYLNELLDHRFYRSFNDSD